MKTDENNMKDRHESTNSSQLAIEIPHYFTH